ncbi:hypothetical protein BC827DRAFT_1224373 [Russula dissimulans]|jgi:hypothetical protein|nr:hypothetical protein BC827DRAFT_1224373 [Russula dissimulans]
MPQADGVDLSIFSLRAARPLLQLNHSFFYSLLDFLLCPCLTAERLINIEYERAAKVTGKNMLDRSFFLRIGSI